MLHVQMLLSNDTYSNQGRHPSDACQQVLHVMHQETMEASQRPFPKTQAGQPPAAGCPLLQERFHEKQLNAKAVNALGHVLSLQGQCQWPPLPDCAS